MAYAGYQNNYNAYGNGYPPGGYGGGNQHSAYSFPPRYQSPQKNAASEYGQPPVCLDTFSRPGTIHSSTPVLLNAFVRGAIAFRLLFVRCPPLSFVPRQPVNEKSGYSFAGGRRAMQPPGGNTSINIYGGYPQNKAQYGYDRAGVAIDPEELGRNGRNIHRKGNMYGQSAYGNQDLSYQLNIPSPAGRQPLDGRRAASQPNQPAYGYSPQAGYGSPGAYGQFGGKIILQPPGGRQSINLFG
eukprot:gene25424-11084_t